MTLPPTYDSPELYFEDCLQFFKQYEYLYNFPNTKILSSKSLDKIGASGILAKDSIDNLEDITNINDDINELLRKAKNLTVQYELCEMECSIDNFDAPLGLKKQHEIKRLAEQITILCEEVSFDTVIDLGSGLGYLGQLVYEKSNYNILGLECNDQHYVGAKKRQRKYHENSLEKVKYVKLKVDKESVANVDAILKDKFPKYEGFCITGLHACADLTINAVNLFLKMAEARALILMSCCYHKMGQENEKFHNFPLSGCLRKIINKHEGYKFMTTPFLRLAAQPPSTDERISDLAFNLLSRSIIQLYADKHDYKLTRRKRKAVKTKYLNNDFESYLQHAKNGFALTCNNNKCGENNNSVNMCKCELSFDSEEILNLWTELCDEVTLKKAAMFILLQRSLQPVFENFILYDRIVYLKENGLDNCVMKKIVNETISPRCLALIAVK